MDLPDWARHAAPLESPTSPLPFAVATATVRIFLSQQALERAKAKKQYPSRGPAKLGAREGKTTGATCIVCCGGCDVHDRQERSNRSSARPPSPSGRALLESVAEPHSHHPRRGAQMVARVLCNLRPQRAPRTGRCMKS